MSNYKKLIDEAMRTAQYRLSSGIDKTASAPNQSSLVKEASELANALEYVAMSATTDSNGIVGEARAEIVRDFFKAATAQRLGVKLAGDVGEHSSNIAGMQALAPDGSKAKLAPKKEVAGNPMVSSAPDSTGNTMLESFKQAESEGQTLYDILMHQKEAGDVGEYDASQSGYSIPRKNENRNVGLINSESRILNYVTKEEAKAPVRKRLLEAFASASDTTGPQTVRAMFPHAFAASGLKKVASVADYIEKAASFIADCVLESVGFEKEANRKQRAKARANRMEMQNRAKADRLVRNKVKEELAIMLRDGKSEDEAFSAVKKKYSEGKYHKDLKLPFSKAQIAQQRDISGKAGQIGKSIKQAPAGSLSLTAADMDRESLLAGAKKRMQYLKPGVVEKNLPQEGTKAFKKEQKRLKRAETQTKLKPELRGKKQTKEELFPERTEAGRKKIQTEMEQDKARADNMKSKKDIKKDREFEAKERKRIKVEANAQRRAGIKDKKKARAIALSESRKRRQAREAANKEKRLQRKAQQATVKKKNRVPVKQRLQEIKETPQQKMDKLQKPFEPKVDPKPKKQVPEAPKQLPMAPKKQVPMAPKPKGNLKKYLLGAGLATLGVGGTVAAKKKYDKSKKQQQQQGAQ